MLLRDSCFNVNKKRIFANNLIYINNINDRFLDESTDKVLNKKKKNKLRHLKDVEAFIRFCKQQQINSSINDRQKGKTVGSVAK